MKRLQTLYKWDPDTRMTRQATKPIQGHTARVPQGDGIPGWLCLTRDPLNSLPVALWVPRKAQAQAQVFRIVMDDRCFEDSILRVEYTPTHLYIADVWMWNGTKLFNKTPFTWRQTFLADSLPLVYTSCPGFESRAVELRTLENLKSSVRGYEYYSNRIGETGLFRVETAPVVPMLAHTDLYKITSTDIPDVYKLDGELGYLRVRTLKLSKTLRAMGESFYLRCVKNPEDDGTWTPVIE
jgi:hypothetical protein